MSKSRLCTTPRPDIIPPGVEDTVKSLGAQLLEVGLPPEQTKSVEAWNCATNVHVCLQTVVAVHSKSQLAHLNISTSSVVILYNQDKAWDQLRLIQFGFCQDSKVGRDLLCAIWACSVVTTPVQLTTKRLLSVQRIRSSLKLITLHATLCQREFVEPTVHLNTCALYSCSDKATGTFRLPRSTGLQRICGHLAVSCMRWYAVTSSPP